MEELIDMLDSSIFTDEIKDKIKEEFDKAVQIGVELELNKLENEKNEENEENEEDKDNDDFDTDLNQEPEYTGDEAVLNKMTKKEIVERADKFTSKEINRVTRAAEAYAKEVEKHITESLTAKGEQYGKLVERKLSAKLDAYLDRMADTIVESYAKENLELKAKIGKAEILVEGFESMLKSGGVYLKDIMLESEKKQLKDNRPDIKIELDNTIVENQKLKKQLFDLEKSNLINEATKDLTVSQKDSITKLVGHIKTTDINLFKDEMKTICEGVISNKSTNTTSSNLVNETIKVDGKETKKDLGVSHNRFF